MSLRRVERFDSSSSTPSSEFHTPRGEDEAADRRLRQSTTSSKGTPSQHQINEFRKQLVEQQNRMDRMESDISRLRDVVMTNIMMTEAALKSNQRDINQLMENSSHFTEVELISLYQELNQQRMRHEDELTRLRSQLSMIKYQVDEATTSSVQAFDEARKAHHFANSYREESSARYQSMAIELNTLRDRADTHEQAICDAHRRHAETTAKQADAEEQHKKDTKKLNERTRLLALRSSQTFRSLLSSTQTNAQSIAETNTNVDNLRQETNERLGIVEQDVETIAATAASNTTAIAQVRDEVQVLARRLQTIETEHGTSISELQRLSEDTQINLEELSLEFLKFASQGVSSFITRLCCLSMQAIGLVYY